MIFWDVAEIQKRMAKRGWANARQLSKGAGISYPAAWQLAQGGPIGRIDTAVLEALAVAFDVEPWALLVYEPD